MVTPSENLPSLSTTAGNLRRGSSLNVLFSSKSSEDAECGGGELRRAGSLRLSRGDSTDAPPRHHRDDRHPAETELEDGRGGNSSGKPGSGKRDAENRNLLDVPDDKVGSTRQRKDTTSAAVGRLAPEASSPARPARPNRHSAPAAAATAAAAAAAAAMAGAAPAPEHLARSLLQLGCPVVSMPKPRGGVGSEQNPQAASSDSDDSTSSHRGPHRHLANSQQHHNAQGQIQGQSLGHQSTVHGYGLLPKVQVSSPPNTPESYYNGSAGSIGARSAPSTPLQGVVGTSQQQQNQQQQASQPVGGLQLTVASVSSIHPPPPPRSPSHAALRCKDSQLSKPLSRSTPSMTAGTVNRSSTRSSPASTSSARQKKFHRHFSQVTADESVLNYYSCALVGDILLQGHLYITPNYFAFYSNVFGYVTKLLIPTVSVLKISKEKTARIIPNAVAVATLDDRHVFCSLLSRDSTFKLMKQVWDAALEARDPVTDVLPLPVETKLLAAPHPSSSFVDDSEVNAEEEEEEDEQEEEEEDEEEDSSMSESGTDLISRPLTAATTAITATPATSIPRLSLTAARLEQIAALPKRLPNERKARIGSFGSLIRCGLRPATIIAILVGLLAALYVSAALMMMRIDRLHTAYVNHPLASPERFTQDRLMQYLTSNLDQIVKVRQSLQILSQQFVAMNRESGSDAALSGGAIEPEEPPS